MIRKEMLETLDIVKSALSDDVLIPVFTNFCFDNTTVHAYKDTLGILMPCNTGKEFAVHGRTLLELLRAASAQELDITLDEEDLHIKCGRSKMKLPYMPKSEFIFEEPEDEKWDIIIDFDSAMLEGLDLCLTTAAKQSTMPAIMGVAVVTGQESCFYSCDGDALSRYKLPDITSDEFNYLMPSEFCEAFLRVAEKTKDTSGTLYLNGDWAIAEFSNDSRVYGRIADNEEPFDFISKKDEVMKSDPKFVEVPKVLISSLKRAQVLADAESQPTSMKVEKGKLRVSTKTSMGDVSDVIMLKKHPDVEANVSAKLVSRAIGLCPEFAILDDISVYRNEGDFLHIVANYEG